LVASIVSNCPEAIVLSCGRTALGLPAEVPLQLGPLAVTPDGEQPSPAAQMFVALARHVAPAAVPATVEGLARVEEVVAEVEGVPVAIEIAARQLRTMTLRELRDALELSRLRLGLLADPVRELREAAQLAWDGIGDDDRDHLVALTHQTSSFTVESAARQLDLDRASATAVLERLHRSALLVARADDHMTFAMLRGVRRAVHEIAGGRAVEATRARYLDHIASEAVDLMSDWCFRRRAVSISALRDRLPAYRRALTSERLTAEQHTIFEAASAAVAGSTSASRRRVAQALPEAISSDGGRIALLSWLRTLCSEGHGSDALPVLNEARQWTDPNLAAHVKLIESELAARTGAFERALASADDAREIAIGHRSEMLEVDADVAAGHAWLAAGQPDRARPRLLAALYALDGEEETHTGLKVRLLLAICRLSERLTADAIQVLVDAIDLARRFHDRRSELTARVLLGWTWWHGGNQDRARGQFRSAELRARQLGLTEFPPVMIAMGICEDRIPDRLGAVSLLAEMSGLGTTFAFCDAVLRTLDPLRPLRSIDAPREVLPISCEDFPTATAWLNGEKLEHELRGPHARWAASLRGSPDRPSPGPVGDVGAARSLWVRAGGHGFEIDSTAYSLRRGSPVARVLRRLAEHAVERPGQAISVAQLLAAGWPGERVLPNAGRSRVYMAISKLRSEGLRDALLRNEDGYLLDPSIVVELDEGS
jgi:tetratricopeptide (TPR) repeat protein